MKVNQKIYPWIVVALLWFVAFFNYMDRQMLSTMQNAIKVDIVELNKAEAFGALMAIFLWIYGILSPFAGIIADKVNRKWLIIISLFVWSGVTFLMGYANTFNQLYILRAIMGISEATYIPSALSLISDWHSGKTRSLAIGIHTTGFYTGQAIGGFGAVIAASYSWHQTFHGFGIIGITFSIILAFTLFENPIHIQKQTTIRGKNNISSIFKDLTILFNNIAFWVILFYFGAPSIPGWATKNWLPTLFSDSLNIPMTKAGPLATITIAISSFIGVLIGGILSDRWVQKNIRGRIFTGAIGLSLTIPSLILLGLGHNIYTIVSAGVLFGIGFGMFDANNMPILCQFVSAKRRATAYGIMNMSGVFAGALITQLMGKTYDEGRLAGAFVVLSIIILIALVLQLTFLKPKTDNMTD